jgi:RNA polymerase sigma-70 factor (ECF subfamily)
MGQRKASVVIKRLVSGVISAVSAGNGAPGFLLFQDGALDQTLSIETDGGKISAIYLVRNPEKLGAVARMPPLNWRQS